MVSFVPSTNETLATLNETLGRADVPPTPRGVFRLVDMDFFEVIIGDLVHIRKNLLLVPANTIVFVLET